jgi:hypothetical protein
MKSAPGSLDRFLFPEFGRVCARKWRRSLGVLIAATLLYPCPFGRTNAAPYAIQPATGLEDRAVLSAHSTVQVKGNVNPWISLSDGHELITGFTGSAEVRNQFASDQLRPLSVAAADLDEDGVPDLVSGYATSDGKGIVAVYSGNVDAIYPNSPAARQRKLDGTFTYAPFLSPARLFDLPSAPDFLETGNFEGTRHMVVVTATRGSNLLCVLDGDGSGALGAVIQIALPGPVTAMASGDVNRADGLKDLVVAIEADAGPELLVFEAPQGALKSTPEAIPISARATSLGIGHLDDDFQSDIAATVGQDLIVVHGRDRLLYMDRDAQRTVAPPRTSVVHTESSLRSVTIGKLSPDGAVRMAILSEEGTLKGVAWNGTSGKKAQYIVAETMATGLAPACNLVKARVSGSASDDLILMDPAGQTIGLWTNDEERRARAAKLGLPALTGENGAAAFDVAGAPAAVLPMRLDSDALDDMVVLIAGRSSPSIVPTACLPGQQCKTIVVGSANDSGPGTLRQAILDANSSATPILISFAIPSAGVPTINLLSPLPTITGNLTIDGTTQQSPTESAVTPQATNMVELNGQNLTADVFVVQSPSNVIRGMVINRSGNGIQITSAGGAGGSNIIEGNLIGTDPTSTVARRNSGRGVLINGSPNNLIGGTASASTNVISGSQTGIEISGGSSTQNQLIFDNIGSDLARNINSALGNSQNGVSITNGASSNAIGAGVPLPGQTVNLIASSGQDGIRIASGTANLVIANLIDSNNGNGVSVNSTGNTIGGSRNVTINAMWRSGAHGVQITSAANNLVQGNYIGFNLNSSSGGPIDMGNALDGINLGGGASGNMIGGVAASSDVVGSNLGNIVGFNHANGVGIAASNTNTVQGNFIGTDVNGPLILNMGNAVDGVNIKGGASGNIIGGGSPSSGNIVGFNHANGVEIASSNTNMVQGNLIGTVTVDKTNYFDVGNMMDGVNMTGGASKTVIGGLNPAAGNKIAFNHGNGVSVLSGNGNSILSDLIWNNTGHGIFLAAGANDNVTAPIVRTAVVPPGLTSLAAASISPAAVTITVSGTLSATANTMMTMQFFLGTACAGTGDEFIGSLPVFLGSQSVTTDGSGNASFSVMLTLPAGSPSTGFINASATNPGESTSSFSQCTAIGTGGCNLTCPANITVAATSSSGAVVNYSAPVPSGSCAGASVICNPASGSVFPIGNTTVTCTVASTSVTCNFVVTVTSTSTGPVLINPGIQGKKFVTTDAGSNIQAGATLNIAGDLYLLTLNGSQWTVFKFDLTQPGSVDKVGLKFKAILTFFSGQNVTVFVMNPDGQKSASQQISVP